MEHTKSELDGQRRVSKPRLEKLEHRKDGRKKPEEAQQLTLKEWPHILDAISDWVCLIDLKGRILRTNRMVEAFTGVRPADSIWQSCCRLVHGSAKRLPGCPVPEMLRTGRRATLELEVPDKKRWLMVIVDPVRDETGNITGAVHIIHDITERKRTELLLQESEQRYRAIFEQAPDSLVLIDAQTGAFVEFNDKAHKNLGYSREEFGNLKLSDFEVIESAEGITRHIEKINRDGADLFETKHRTKDGKIRDIQVNTKTVTIDGKEFVQAIWHDVTERKQAEEALRESEKRFQQIAENTQEWIWEVDLHGLYTYSSSIAEKILGYKPEELVGKKHFYDLFPPEEREELKKAVFEIFAQKQPFRDFINRNVHRNGETVWLSTSAVPIFGKERNLLGYRGADIDITERKKAKEILRESENKYRTLLRNIPQGIFYKDLNSVYILCNESYAQDLGITPCEIKGMTDYDFYPEELAEKYRAYDKRIIQSGRPEEIEEEYIKNGQKRIIHTLKAPINDENDNIIGIFGIFWDITDRKQMEQALLEGEKLAAKGQMAAQIAHELNNPLAGIKNSLLLLKDAVSKDHRHYHYLGLVSNEIDRLSHIVHQMFDFYRPAEAQANTFSVYNAVSEVTELLEVRRREYKVAVNIISSKKKSVVRLPENLLRQVLYNIIKNAIEASPPGAAVEVRPKITAGTLTIKVHNQGSGIPQDVQPHIFEPSFTTKKGLAAGGLGLGLSVSRDIVEQMGGRLDFESKTGRGTTFSITIPFPEIGKEPQDG